MEVIHWAGLNPAPSDFEGAAQAVRDVVHLRMLLLALVRAVLDGYPWRGRDDLVPVFDPSQTYLPDALVALPREDESGLRPDTWLVAQVETVEKAQNPAQGTFQVVSLRLGDKKCLFAAGIPSAKPLPLRFPPEDPEDVEWLVSYFVDAHHDRLAFLVREAAGTGALPVLLQGDQVLRKDELVPLDNAWHDRLKQHFDGLISRSALFLTLDDLLAGLRAEGWAEGVPHAVARFSLEWHLRQAGYRELGGQRWTSAQVPEALRRQVIRRPKVPIVRSKVAQEQGVDDTPSFHSYDEVPLEATEARDALDEMGEDAELEAPSPPQTLDEWRRAAPSGPIRLLPLTYQHIHEAFFPLTKDLASAFPPGDDPLLVHITVVEGDPLPCLVSREEKVIKAVDAREFADRFLSRGIPAGTHLWLERLGDYEYRVFPKPLPEGRPVRCKLLTREGGGLRVEEAEIPMRYEGDPHLFKAELRFEDLEALFQEAEELGWSIFDAMWHTFPDLARLDPEGKVHWKDLFHVVFCRCRMCSPRSVITELYTRDCFVPVGGGYFRLEPQRGIARQPAGRRRPLVAPAPKPPRAERGKPLPSVPAEPVPPEGPPQVAEDVVQPRPEFGRGQLRKPRLPGTEPPAPLLEKATEPEARQEVPAEPLKAVPREREPVPQEEQGTEPLAGPLEETLQERALTLPAVEGRPGQEVETARPSPEGLGMPTPTPQPTPAPAEKPPPRPLSSPLPSRLQRPRLAAKSLFSQHYLEHRIQGHPEWQEDVSEPLARLRALYAQKEPHLPTLNEAQTEDEFIRPVLEALGFAYIRQAPTRRAGRVQRPDFVLFATEQDKGSAYPLQGDDAAFYARAVAVADAKYWERPLSRVNPDDPRDAFRNANPSFQIVNYLIGTGVDWGILTNGRHWRLYYRQASSTATEFYEVDLVDLLERGDPEDFKRFWLFFRREAFLKDAQGRNFLERVREGSATYAQTVGDRLKDLVFREVFPFFAGGFAAYGASRAEDVTCEEACRAIYKATLSFLYKLLFLFYAEARGLLPVDNPGYRSKSLTSLAREIADKVDRREPLGETSTDFYDRLLNLFRLVDQGDRGLGLPRYNGGLFHFTFRGTGAREKHAANWFLAHHRMADRFLADGLDRLYRAGGEPVDYGYLDVRHLGAIYEGLLEHHLVVDDAARGEVHLQTDKGERKATGSYYTPDYIVKYIVRHTLGPILEERAVRFGELMERIQEVRRRLAAPGEAGGVRALRQELERLEEQARETLLDIKVCDPAMGSGHFLVEAVDFLTDGLVDILNRYPEHNPVLEMLARVREDIVENLAAQGIAVDPRRLDDTQLLQRVVMKRCIYGVDLNPMAVELAKVSLWLHTFTVGAPLSFLDHHLRCGNSLIGAMARDVERELAAPDSRGQLTFLTGPFAGLLRAAEIMRGISLLCDATYEEVEKSEELFRGFDEAAKPYKQLLDIYVAQHFGVRHAKEFLTLYGPDAMKLGPEAVSEPYRTVMREAQRLWREKRFFHWDLEFPEAFIDLRRAAWKEKPGFDAVVGNPPYSTSLRIDDRRYVESALPRTGKGYKNLALHFIEVACGRSAGLFGFIVPKSVCYSEGWRPAVDILWPSLTHAIDASKAWEDVRLEMVVLIADLRVRVAHYKAGSFAGSRTSEVVVDKQRWERFRVVVTSVAEPELHVGESVWRTARPMGTVVANSRGLGWQRFCRPVGTIPVICGDAIARYEVAFNTFLTEDLQQSLELARQAQWCRNRRVVAQNIVAHVTQPTDHLVIMCALADANSVPLDTVNNLMVKATPWQPEALLTLLNSGLISWYAYRFVYNRAIRTMHFDEAYTDKLPLPRITFTTPARERARLLEEGKRLAEEFPSPLPPGPLPLSVAERERGDGGWGEVPYPTFLASPLGRWLEARLTARHIPDPALVRQHNADPLNQDWQLPEEGPVEQSDVVHDLLAHLAEQMIEMNKAKQAETKGFLQWLEREIGAPVDGLTGKTRVQGYLGDYQKGEAHLTFEDLLEVLRKNQRKLTVDPAERAFQERLKGEYEASLQRLLSLKARLAATDRLIDLIVYRLYGLTEEEVAVVEGRSG